jgi:hypothetical protein
LRFFRPNHDDVTSSWFGRAALGAAVRAVAAGLARVDVKNVR